MSLRKSLIVSVSAIVLATGLGACSGSSDSASPSAGESSSGGTVTLTVGASPTPHANILHYVAENLAADAGIELKIVEYQDYIQPNVALNSGEIDANYFQTVPYLEDQSKQNGYNFDHGEGIHLEPLGIYSNTVKNVAEVKDGAKVGIINDPTNQARALNLLKQAGLITLPDGQVPTVAEVEASKDYNPHGFTFTEVEGPQLVRTLDDVEIAVINGNYAQAGGKSPAEAIEIEEADNNPALNILAWKADSQKAETIKKLDELLHSQQVKDYITQSWPDKSVIPVA